MPGRAAEAPGLPKTALVFGLVVLALAASSAGMCYRGQIPFSSDQAVSPLMALDIRDRGTHPIFCWGGEYAGTFEPHVLSLVFRLVPPSVSAYRVTMFLLLAAATILVVAACRSAFGTRAGLLAGLYLGLGPSFYFYKGLTSDVAYVSVFAALCASVATAAWLAAGQTRNRERAGVFVLGACLGLAWWIHPLSVVMGPILGIPILRDARRWLRPALIGLFLAGFAVGGAPWLEKNFRNGFASLKAQEMSAATAAAAMTQVQQLVERGVPILLGGRSAWGSTSTFPYAPVLAVGLLGAVLVYGSVRFAREREPGPRFLLFVSLGVIVLPVAQALAMARTDLTHDVRYLLPAYIGVAILTGSLLDWLLAERRWVSAVALAGAALALGPGSQLTALRFADRPLYGRLRETRHLADDLVEAGHRDIYASYWVAFRLMFLSEGKLTAASFGEGNDGVERSERFRQEVDASPNPGFLLQDDPARGLEAFLSSRGARFTSRKFPALGFSLITDVPPERLADLRRCRCIPAPIEEDSIEWLDIQGPTALRAGQRATFQVRFRSRVPLNSRVSLAPRWKLRTEDFGVEGERTHLPPAPSPDGVFEVDVAARAILTPGQYLLTIDLVEEAVTWFEWRGIVPPSMEVHIVP